MMKSSVEISKISDASRMLEKMKLNVTELTGNFGCSRFANEARLRSEAEFKQFNFGVYDAEIITFCAFSYPLLPKEEFCICSEIYVLMGAIDNIFDDSKVDVEVKRHYLEDVESALMTGKASKEGEGPVALLLLYLSRITNISLRKHMTDSLKIYLKAISDIIDKQTTVLEPEEYLSIRMKDSGWDTTCAMIFLDKLNFEPYKQFLTTPLGSKVSGLANMNMCLLNDVVSLKKEKRTGSKFNMVISLMKHNSMTEVEAIEEIIGRATRCFKEMESTKLDEIGNEVVNKMILFCRGHNIWSLSTTRYA